MEKVIGFSFEEHTVSINSLVIEFVGFCIPYGKFTIRTILNLSVYRTSHY